MASNVLIMRPEDCLAPSMRLLVSMRNALQVSHAERRQQVNRIIPALLCSALIEETFDICIGCYTNLLLQKFDFA